MIDPENTIYNHHSNITTKNSGYHQKIINDSFDDFLSSIRKCKICGSQFGKNLPRKSHSIPRNSVLKNLANKKGDILAIEGTPLFEFNQMPSLFSDKSAIKYGNIASSPIFRLLDRKTKKCEWDDNYEKDVSKKFERYDYERIYIKAFLHEYFNAKMNIFFNKRLNKEIRNYNRLDPSLAYFKDLLPDFNFEHKLQKSNSVINLYKKNQLQTKIIWDSYNTDLTINIKAAYSRPVALFLLNGSIYLGVLSIFPTSNQNSRVIISTHNSSEDVDFLTRNFSKLSTESIAFGIATMIINNSVSGLVLPPMKDIEYYIANLQGFAHFEHKNEYAIYTEQYYTNFMAFFKCENLTDQKSVVAKQRLNSLMFEKILWNNEKPVIY